MLRSGSRLTNAIYSVFIAVALAAPCSAIAQQYPTQSVRIIVPFPAGGINDAVARLIGPYLQDALGQPVIIDNRPGASGIIGTNAVVTAPNDGHTLVMVASSHTVAPATGVKLPYDTENDLAAVAMVTKNPMLFVVGKNVQASTLPEFISLAKAAPGQLNYATVGNASQSHLVTVLLEQRAGIRLQHIPYRGGAPAITSLLTGETQFAVLSPQVSLPQMDANLIRALAVGSLTRDPQFINIPTVAEQGYPGFEAVQWVGLLAPAGTSREVIGRLNAEVNRALQDPDLIAKLVPLGMSAAGGTPGDFQKVITSEIKLWTEIAHSANIQGQ
ncbi:MAG: Bug family tripartite tricarboxylate transporter substrate binding protein [Xanthobacteraceae bacterium]